MCTDHGLPAVPAFPGAAVPLGTPAPPTPAPAPPGVFSSALPGAPSADSALVSGVAASSSGLAEVPAADVSDSEKVNFILDSMSMKHKTVTKKDLIQTEISHVSEQLSPIKRDLVDLNERFCTVEQFRALFLSLVYGILVMFPRCPI
eukprot:7073174-Pyramimonas_sp.AAC.2